MKTAIKLILIYLGIQLICGGLIGIPFTIIARMNGGSVDATRVSELTLAPSMLLSMAVMFFYGKHTIYPKTRQVGHSFHFHF